MVRSFETCKTILLFFCITTFLFSCEKKQDDTFTPDPIPVTPGISILTQLELNYAPLPEKKITISDNGNVYAQYAQPTVKYGHAVLGDGIEAEKLVLVVDSTFYELTLGDDYVFEDIQPRLYDVDMDGELEIISIRTNVNLGAGIVIYKLVDGQLTEYAAVEEIGLGFRWLNIVGINDLDQNGSLELIWIQTPHIGGILKVATITNGTLSVLDEKSQYSNHGSGERNLCLSVITNENNQKVISVPAQNRNQIVKFTFNNDALEIIEEIDQQIDFSLPLVSQYAFQGTLEDEVNNCEE